MMNKLVLKILIFRQLLLRKYNNNTAVGTKQMHNLSNTIKDVIEINDNSFGIFLET